MFKFKYQCKGLNPTNLEVQQYVSLKRIVIKLLKIYLGIMPFYDLIAYGGCNFYSMQ